MTSGAPSRPQEPPERTRQENEEAASLAHSQGFRLLPLHASPHGDGRCSCNHVERADGSCECGNPKCRVKHSEKTTGKHPRVSDWLADPPDIEMTLDFIRTKRPEEVNLGIITGAVSGVFILDVDPRGGGNESRAALEAKHGPLPLTVESRTGGGGGHCYFLYPGHEVPCSSGKIAPGLDIKGDRGYVVAPPSVSGSGPYTWVHAPGDVPIAPAPAWLLAEIGRVSPPRAETAAPAERGHFPPAAPEVLEAAAEDLVEHGPAVQGQGGDSHAYVGGAILMNDHALTEDEAWPLFLEWNKTCVPPWAEHELDELREKLRRGLKYAKRPYGCRRTMDAVEQARMRIAEWRERDARITDEREHERAEDTLIQECRALVEKCGDPLHRERIQNELMGATGKRATALALPRVKVLPASRPEVSTVQGTWREYGLDLTSGGVPIANIDNAVHVLEHEKHPSFYEEFSQRVRGPHGEWTDADDLALTLEMQRRIGLSKMTPQIVSQAVQAYARKRARDVVREWLEALKWDGEERTPGFFTRAYGAEDSEYTSAASSNFWKSSAARLLMPECKVDTMVVLEGAQGLKKSTSLRVIAGDRFFAEASESPTSKDFFLALQGKMLVEVGEMDSFSRSEVAAVKRVLSCQVDRFRAPYERAARDWPRRGVFVGTTNRSDWARDDTGGRRFWPIACSRVDLEYIRANRDQLFAEAVARVKRGESWWVMPAEATAREQEARRQVHPWEELIREYLTREGAPAEVTTTSVMQSVLNMERARMDRAAEMQVASILKRLGFMKVDGWRDGRKTRFWRKV